MRDKQMELEQWMKKYKCDICAIIETGLNGNEYVEVSDEYKWVGANSDWMRGKSGGVGFVIKSDMECQKISCDSEDVCFIKIGSHAKGYELVLGSIYLSCEGIRGEENVLKMRCVKDVVSKAKEASLKMMIGGDMNAHIWELDKCENKNGKLLKRVIGV